LKLLLDIGRKPIHTFAEVDRLGCHEHSDAGRRNDHDTAFRARSTPLSALVSTGPLMRMVAMPIAISIEVAGASLPDAGGTGTRSAIITGANEGASVSTERSGSALGTCSRT